MSIFYSFYGGMGHLTILMGFEPITYRWNSVVNSLTHCATLFGGIIGKETNNHRVFATLCLLTNLTIQVIHLSIKKSLSNEVWRPIAFVRFFYIRFVLSSEIVYRVSRRWLNRIVQTLEYDARIPANMVVHIDLIFSFGVGQLICVWGRMGGGGKGCGV